MALLHMESFDHLLSAQFGAKWTVVASSGATGGINAIAAVGRRGTNGLQLQGRPNTGNSGSVLKSLTPTGTTIVVGKAVRWTGINTAYNFFDSPNLLAVRKGGSHQFQVKVNPASGLLDIWRGASTTFITSTSVALSALTLTYIELKAVVEPGTAGVLELRFNGTPVLTIPAENLCQTGVAGWDQIQLGPIFSGAGSGGANMQYDYDDLYVLDGSGPAPWNNFLGDCRVSAFLPTAEGDLSMFAPLTGTDNSLMVKELTPDDDVTYVSSVTPGDIDTYVIPDALVGAAPTGIQLVVYGKKAAEGLAPTSGVVRIGGVNYLVPLVNLGTTYGCRTVPIGPSPATGLPFTEAEFNAAQFGYARG